MRRFRRAPPTLAATFLESGHAGHRPESPTAGRRGWYARISTRGSGGRSRRVERFIRPDRTAADEYLAAWRADEERRRQGVVRLTLLAKFAADELFPVRAPVMRPKSFEVFSCAILIAAEHFGRRPMYSITAADAASYVAEFVRRGRAANTIRNQVNTLRAAWNVAVDGRVALENPWAKVAVPRIDGRPVPPRSHPGCRHVGAGRRSMTD